MAKICICERKSKYIKSLHALYGFTGSIISVRFVAYPVAKPLVAIKIKGIVNEECHLFDKHNPLAALKLFSSSARQCIDGRIGN